MWDWLWIDPWSYILWAWLVLVVPIPWVLAAALAAAVHECAHMAMIWLTGGSISGLRIVPGGAQICTQIQDPWQELLCALAGPAGSFMLIFLCRWLPKTSICAVLQGCFNLLPIYPLDGGRALRCLWRILCRKKPCIASRFNVQ